MASSPLTQFQIPDKSILDVNGRQTYLGNSFILPQNGKALSDESEDVIAIITNPAASGKSLFLFARKVSTDNNTVQVRYYANPVINSAGSATAALNLRTGFQSIVSSVSVNYLSPTVTSKGTFIACLPATIYNMSSDTLFIIDPGNSMLITGEQLSSGTTNVFLENTWYEI